MYKVSSPVSFDRRYLLGAKFFFCKKYSLTMAYTCLIVLDPEIPFTLPEMKGISGTDGANYKVIK